MALHSHELVLLPHICMLTMNVLPPYENGSQCHRYEEIVVVDLGPDVKPLLIALLCSSAYHLKSSRIWDF